MTNSGRFATTALDNRGFATVRAAARKSAAEAPPLPPRAIRVIRDVLKRQELWTADPETTVRAPTFKRHRADASHLMTP